MRNLQNSQQTAFPNFNEQGIFNPGLTKAEYGTLLFVAAHLEAHGKYPTGDQIEALAALAIKTLDVEVGKVMREIYGELEQDFPDPENVDPEMEIDQVNSPFQDPNFSQE